MINIAIVEDDLSVVREIYGFFDRITKEFNEDEFHINIYPNAIVFLQNFKSQYDVVLMDIEMPHMNGMEAAKRLRELDDGVALMFVTNMRQYAVKGYEVKALDFLVKPVHYKTFVMKMMRILRYIKSREDKYITIKTTTSIVRIALSDLYYVEVDRHTLLYHTKDGVLEGRGNISNVEASLSKYHFLRSNNSYLVNPRHIKQITGNVVVIHGEELLISRPRKKAFLESLTKYFEENGV